jgi:hypothetical protein
MVILPISVLKHDLSRYQLLDQQFTQAMGNIFIMDVLSRVNQILFAEEFSTFTQPQKTAFYRSVYFALPQNQQQFNGDTYEQNVSILKAQHNIKSAMEKWKVGQIAMILARNRQYRLYKKVKRSHISLLAYGLCYSLDPLFYLILRW